MPEILIELPIIYCHRDNCSALSGKPLTKTLFPSKVLET